MRSINGGYIQVGADEGTDVDGANVGELLDGENVVGGVGESVGESVVGSKVVGLVGDIVGA